MQSLLSDNPQPPARWHEDQPALNVLDRPNAPHRYIHDVAITSINERHSFENKARKFSLTGLDPHMVDDYSAAMARGESFPALVAFREPNGQWVLAGGNHRLAAAKRAGFTHVDLYEADVDDAPIRDAITRTLSRATGNRGTLEEAITGALEWMITWGSTPKEAARVFELSERTIRDRQRYNERLGLLHVLGVRNPTANIPKSIIVRLGTIPNHIVLKELASYLASEKRSEPACNAIIDAVLERTDEAAQLEVVRSYRRKPKLPLASPHGRARTATPSQQHRMVLYGHLVKTRKHLQRYPSRAEMGLTDPDYYQRAIQVAKENLDALTQMRAQ